MVAESLNGAALLKELREYCANTDISEQVRDALTSVPSGDWVDEYADGTGDCCKCGAPMGLELRDSDLCDPCWIEEEC